ncbi:hypothetical protein FSP39_006761 [Pinctada imbricata]|uniref:SREBP regulating gene protein n=1 Tax=Pinctada imbricata TaxID=66713 RepID=A0AA88XMS1_PINIB|nr:hypothetical protein FSP39_006761 [Pinctada imbricata]
MYDNSESCVKIDGEQTKYFTNNIGVKQGEVLSPILFNLFINDLPGCLSDKDSPVINDSTVKCLLYADDLVIMSTSKSGIQQKFDELGEYCKKWRLHVNTDKTMVMEIANNSKVSKNADIKFNGEYIAYTKSYKYLGVIFDACNNFSIARNNMYERGHKALFKLKSVVDREFFSPKTSNLVQEDYQIKHILLRQPFEWQPKVPDRPHKSANGTVKQICRNSVQGKQLIVDERGYVCNRSDIDIGGCCRTELSSTSKHSCDTCKRSSCCVIYEYCVSCCLGPDKRPLLQKILTNARETLDIALGSASNHFDLCLAKCRTSSQSVQHENSYRNSLLKHCYGENPPELQPLSS